MLAAFEQVHADELRRFEERLAAYCQMQNGELQMLRAQLKTRLSHKAQTLNGLSRATSRVRRRAPMAIGP
jgi:acyl-CoA hydrolase